MKKAAKSGSVTVKHRIRIQSFSGQSTIEATPDDKSGRVFLFDGNEGVLLTDILGKYDMKIVRLSYGAGGNREHDLVCFEVNLPPDVAQVLPPLSGIQKSANTRLTHKEAADMAKIDDMEYLRNLLASRALVR